MNHQSTTFPLELAIAIMQIPGGKKEFLTWLRANEYLTDRSLPSQTTINSRLIFHSYVPMPNKRIKIQLHLTIKGLAYFSKKLNRGNYLARDWAFPTDLLPANPTKVNHDK